MLLVDSTLYLGLAQVLVNFESAHIQLSPWYQRSLNKGAGTTFNTKVTE